MKKEEMTETVGTEKPKRTDRNNTNRNRNRREKKRRRNQKGNNNRTWERHP